MKKTDIAALVAAGLEAEFGNYRNAELQVITAVNDGQHGESVPFCLFLTKKGESLKAFNAQRIDWWNALFEGRVTLDQAAGLLLGFSQVMTMNAKFVDAHKSNLRAPSRPLSHLLVKAFADMRGRIADWRTTSDGKYETDELIPWAKEKDFVADEVLKAWDDYKQPKSWEAGQLGAPVKAESKPGDAWMAEALEKAKNIIAREGKKGLHPNLITIADEIAKDWRSQGKHGPKGTPLSGAYIKRHALQATGIAINRSRIISA